MPRSGDARNIQSPGSRPRNTRRTSARCGWQCQPPVSAYHHRPRPRQPEPPSICKLRAGLEFGHTLKARANIDSIATQHSGIRSQRKRQAGLLLIVARIIRPCCQVSEPARCASSTALLAAPLRRVDPVERPPVAPFVPGPPGRCRVWQFPYSAVASIVGHCQRPPPFLFSVLPLGFGITEQKRLLEVSSVPPSLSRLCIVSLGMGFRRGLVASRCLDRRAAPYLFFCSGFPILGVEQKTETGSWPFRVDAVLLRVALHATAPGQDISRFAQVEKRTNHGSLGC